MKGPLFSLLVILAILALFTPSIFYIVGEADQAVVLQFSKPVRVIVNRTTPEEFEEIKAEIESESDSAVGVAYGPGLYMKIPFIQSVRPFDARYLDYDEDPRDIVTVDKQQIKVDSYARWRIHNPLKFLLSVQEETRATRRLSDIISAGLRETLGSQSHYEIIRSTTRPIVVTESFSDGGQSYQMPVTYGREALMQRITEQCDKTVRQYGMKVTDVRVKQVEFLGENAQFVYQRMIAERQRIATRFENEGTREAQIITSDTDRRVAVILAEAEKRNLEIKGAADAEAARIYAEGFEEPLPDGSTQKVEGYGAEPEFFEFLRKLEALKNSVHSGERLILSTDSPLFQIFNPEEIEAANPIE